MPRHATTRLGLAIVAGIARGLGHAVGLQPLRGKVISVISNAQRTGAGARMGTVLLVEDDAASREATRELLALMGYSAAAVSSKKDALGWCEHNKAPSLIVSDYLLPDNATGIDVVREVRDLFGEAMPAILVTGLTDPDIAAQAHRGACALLRKPVSTHDLFAILETFMVRPVASDTHGIER